MERYAVFLGWKHQYCENNYTTKYNLQIQCDHYQITNDIFFHINRPTTTATTNSYSQFLWKHKRPQLAKAVFSQSKRRMKLVESTFLTSDYTTKLQSSRQYGTDTKMKIQTNRTR